jgi:hypothetical protein
MHEREEVSNGYQSQDEEKQEGDRNQWEDWEVNEGDC